MVTFDSILNFILPPLIIIIALWLLTRPFKEPLGDLLEWIKGLFTGEHKKDKGVQIQYE